MFFITILISLFPLAKSYSQDLNQNIYDKWNSIDNKIVNQTIDINDAIESLKVYEPLIRNFFRHKKGELLKRIDWVFPLKHYTSIYYRDDGNDYRLDGYDYFQGSNSKGHPAHDIMILDKNKDLLDDSTSEPVDVLSMSSGMVIAIDTNWKTGSLLRGGKFVKIFDVTNNGIFYYSHLSKVNVIPGDIVNAGDKIGEVGRTGRKAILADGKTHLHIAFLKSVNGYPLPEDIINDLRAAEQRNNTKR